MKIIELKPADIGDLRNFIRSKIVEVEKSIAARRQMSKTFREGSYKDWGDAARIDPSTIGRAMKKTERAKAAATHDRIVIELMCDLKLLNEVLDALHTASL